MSKLEKGLKEWVALDFISQEQANRIHNHESTKPESSWILSGLLILGVVIIAIGIISMIAANWNQIPDIVKLAADFILLGGLAFATLQSWESKKSILFEALLLFFLLLCLASIGLISQIYHTGGKLYQALMLWSLITAPAAMASRNAFVPFIWTGAFLTGLIYMAVDSVAAQSIFNGNNQAVFMALPLLCAGLTIVSKTLAGEIGSTRAFRAWTLLGGLIALFFGEVDWMQKAVTANGLIAYLPGYFLAVVVAAAIWQSLDYRRTQKIVLLVTLGIFLMPFHLPFFGGRSPIFQAVFTILVLSLMSIFIASLKERLLFQWFLSLLGLRFLVLYFQALGGLATTGLGLIISGGMVIGMAIAWNKYRIKIADWAERSAQ